MRVVKGEGEVLQGEVIAHILSSDGLEVLASVGDAVQLEREVARHSPDLVVTDIRMPPSYTHEGLVSALRIRRTHPGIGVVVVSQHVQRRYATELLDGGNGVGYLFKQRIADIRTFTSDIQRVAACRTALDPEVVPVLVARASQGTSEVGRLTPRQVEVLGLQVYADDHRRVLAVIRYLQAAVLTGTLRPRAPGECGA